MQVDHAQLTAGLYANAAALHPQHATIAVVSQYERCNTILLPSKLHTPPEEEIGLFQGAEGALGEFDVSSGCCLATAELRSTPSNLAYSMDGRLLVVLLQVWEQDAVITVAACSESPTQDVLVQHSHADLL